MDSALEMRVDAELCLELGSLGTVSNRLYYACFRAAQAALHHVDVFLDTIRTTLVPGHEVSDKIRDREAQIEQVRVHLRRGPRANRRSDPTER